MIPKIIHQIWHPFGRAPLPDEWRRHAGSWQRQHPEHEYRVWEPAQSTAFVAEHYPAFLPTYNGYRRPIQRVDALRVLLLHHFGGLCVDFDMECLRNTCDLFSGVALAMSLEPLNHFPLRSLTYSGRMLSSVVVASEPGHPFWTEVIEALRASAQVEDVGESTGCVLLTRCYEGYTDKTGLTVLPPEVFHPLSEAEYVDHSAFDLERWAKATSRAHGIHHWARSWSAFRSPRVPGRRYYRQGVPLRLRYPSLSTARGSSVATDGPKVSCLMVTRGHSEPARWSIECFRQQTYGNRELVIVTTNGTGDIEAYVKQLGDPMIRFAGVLPVDTTLGDQRNAAVERAAGDYVCTWDDDDLFGADRLAVCMTAILGSNAVAAMLERVCIWAPAQRILLLSGKYTWENTLVARRDVLARYPAMNKAEDTHVVRALLAEHPVMLVDDPNLYTYVCWGSNTWGMDHFQKLFKQATLEIEASRYEQALSIMDRHFPLREYLAWLEERDPTLFKRPATFSRQPASVQEKAPAAKLSPAGVVGQGHMVVGEPGTVMMAWEIGAGLGHTVPLSQIARELLKQGYRVHMVLMDLSTTRAALGDLVGHPRLALWQAPYWSFPLASASEPATYPELLFRAGYLDAQRLAGLVAGWSSLMDLLKPDLLLVDHAPTALLAARGRRIKTAQIGTGFFVPVQQAPIPSFRTWEPIAANRIERSESLVLETCNAILAERGQPLLEQFVHLLACDETFLVTVPELDHFERRGRDPRQEYYGALPAASHGRPAQWPPGTTPTLFVYLNTHRATMDVLRVLKSTAWRVLAYVPGLTASAVAESSGPGLRIVTEPVNMEDVCRGANAVLCQAGASTVATALHAGKPLIMLPTHVEQLLLSRRVQALGAGLYITDDQMSQLGHVLDRLFTQPSFGEAALRFARKHARPPSECTATAVARRCGELIHAGRARLPRQKVAA